MPEEDEEEEVDEEEAGAEEEGLRLDDRVAILFLPGELDFFAFTLFFFERADFDFACERVRTRFLFATTPEAGAASASGSAAAGADGTAATAPSEKTSAPIVPTRTCLEEPATDEEEEEEEDDDDEVEEEEEVRVDARVARRLTDLRLFFLAPLLRSSFGLTSPRAVLLDPFLRLRLFRVLMALSTAPAPFLRAAAAASSCLARRVFIVLKTKVQKFPSNCEIRKDTLDIVRSVTRG